MQRLDLETGDLEVLYSECDGTPLVGPNDLVFDDTGHFWVTDFGGNRICYAAADGSGISSKIECGFNGAPNGVGLSPDGSTLYWSDTARRQVGRRRLSAPGEVIPTTGFDFFTIINGDELDPDVVLAGMPGGCYYDSLAVDSTGAVCVGTLVVSGITAISADGTDAELLTLPSALNDRLITNICFGGADLQTAYLTGAETGRLYKCRWQSPGLKLQYQH